MPDQPESQHFTTKVTLAGEPSTPPVESPPFTTVVSPGAAPADASRPVTLIADRYELVAEVARGGMGAVYRCRDRVLGRELAIKLMHERLAHRHDLASRFVDEARVGGQLQHPNIVPVYDLGRLPDGRPMLAMKLVKGRTLDELLRERPSPAHDPGRFLNVFFQVCQAVGYAHSKHVVHRDLKPLNVMVGAFGEVQVMDWGLAKVLACVPSAPDEPQAGSVVETERSADDGPGTRAGAMLGTPAYMSPEQALGELDRLDERGDVFGLGAILCEVLTGQPPYVGANTGEVVRLAKRGDLAECLARLDGCGADAELVALAKACLAREPDGRPRDGAAVAAAVAAHLDGVRERLRQSELERAAAEVRATEERKRRRVQLQWAVAVLALVAALGGGAWLAYDRRSHAEEAVARLLAEAERRQKAAAAAPFGEMVSQAQAAVDAARQAADLARGSFCPADLRERAEAALREAEAELAAVERDHTLLIALLNVHRPRETPAFQRSDKGLIIQLAEPSAEEQYVAAFREWGLDVDATSIDEAAARIRARPRIVAEVAAALDVWAADRRKKKPRGVDWRRPAELAIALDDKPGSWRRELRDILTRGTLERERAVGDVLAALMPYSALTGWVYGGDRKRLRELAGSIEKSSESIPTVLLLARALRTADDDEEAKRLLRSALIRHPQEVALYLALADLLERQKRWPEAVETYRTVRALRAESGVKLANALVRAGHGGEALDVSEELLRLAPENPRFHRVLGDTLSKLSRYREAEASYLKAIRLDSNDALAHHALGESLHSQGRYREAVAAHREAIRLLPTFGLPYFDLGVTLVNLSWHKEAEMAFRMASWLLPDLAEAHNNLGVTLFTQSRFEEAEAAFREAVRLNPTSALAHDTLGCCLLVRGREAEAEVALREAVRLKPDFAEAHSQLGSLLNTRGRPKEAEAACREAVRLEPECPSAHYELGRVLNSQGRHREAEAPLREAVRLMPDLALAHGHLGVALTELGRFSEAEQSLRQAIRLNPGVTLLHGNLAAALAFQGDWAEATMALQRGRDTMPADDPSRDDFDQLIRLGETAARLAPQLPALFSGRVPPQDSKEALTLAQLCQEVCRNATAARLYWLAFAADPKAAADLDAGHRSYAASAAALAATGRGNDVAGLDPEEAAHLRGWAFGWLGDDLAARAGRLANGRADDWAEAGGHFLRWQTDPALAGVRDANSLAALPADEREQWRRLWADVAALLWQIAEAD